MKKVLVLGLLLVNGLGFSQINVNKEDIKDKVTMFEVWAFKKPFTSKECYFINYGQDNFKPSNYDLLGQGIRNANDDKFEKGEWLKLIQYLESQGFIKDDERNETIGNINGRIITFKKK
jgi:hypothetical protein